MWVFYTLVFAATAILFERWRLVNAFIALLGVAQIALWLNFRAKHRADRDA